MFRLYIKLHCLTNEDVCFGFGERERERERDRIVRCLHVGDYSLYVRCYVGYAPSLRSTLEEL